MAGRGVCALEVYGGGRLPNQSHLGLILLTSTLILLLDSHRQNLSSPPPEISTVVSTGTERESPPPSSLFPSPIAKALPATFFLPHLASVCSLDSLWTLMTGTISLTLQRTKK